MSLKSNEQLLINSNFELQRSFIGEDLKSGLELGNCLAEVFKLEGFAPTNNAATSSTEEEKVDKYNSCKIVKICLVNEFDEKS